MKQISMVFLLLLQVLLGMTPLLSKEEEVPSHASKEFPNIFLGPESEIPENSSYGEDKFFGEFMRMLVILSSIIAALLIFAWFAKKFLTGRLEQINADSPIKVLERRILTPKTTVYILDLQGEKIALAESHHGVAFLRLPGNTFSTEKI
jgi:flagellar biogenesis protein FliO